MAIRIINRTHTALPCGEAVEIITDTEDEITALGNEVADAYQTVKAAAGSLAYVADMSAVYRMSPAGVWIKEVSAGGETLPNAEEASF